MLGVCLGNMGFVFGTGRICPQFQKVLKEEEIARKIDVYLES